MVYRKECERRGFEIGPLLRGDFKDYQRSCERGLGGSVRPRAIPLELLSKLPASREPWTSDGPINPKAAIIVGSWWLCREVELATARARLVEVQWQASPPLATWHLPTSKSDPQALGMARTLRCNCTEFGRAGCPVHVMWDHLAYLRMQFTSRWSEDGPAWDLPLFPRFDGGVVCKAAMAKTIAHAATTLHVPLSAPDGSERVSGHSLRVTGAQGLARLGWDLWAIQLQGRWHSDVVKHYVRDAHLSPVGAAAHSGSGPTLEQVVDAVLRKLGGVAQVGSGDLPKSGGSAQPHGEWFAPLVSAEQPARSAEPGLSPEKLVLHTGSGIYHRLPEQGSSRTACGWGFASSEVAVMVPDCSAGPHAWFQLCSRCWPQARELAKTNPQPMALARPSAAALCT